MELLILSRPREFLLRGWLGMLNSYVPEDFGAPGLHGIELSHADDRGPLAPAGDVAGRERVGEIDAAAFHLLCVKRRAGGRLCVAVGSGQGQSGAELLI